MKAKQLLKLFWREGSLVLLLLIPWLALVPFGLLWLWDNHAIRWWFATLVVLGLGAVALRVAIAKSAKGEAASLAEAASPPSPEWSLREKEAWRLVEEVVRETEPFASTDPAPIRAALERTISAVAQHLKGDASEARLDVTLPELLMLAERTARDARRAALAHVPGIRLVTFGHLIWVKRQSETYGPAASRAYTVAQWAYRIQRAVRDPTSGLLGEAARLLFDTGSKVLSLRVRAALTAVLIRECGRAAIDLYSGRLRLSTEDIARADLTDKAAIDEIGPVRILFAGQVNAGKSSLFNALAGQVHREVGVEVSRQQPSEVRISREGHPEVVLREMSGLPGSDLEADTLLREFKGADLVIWVASAVQPARKPDVEALRFVRDAFARDPSWVSPPMLLALSHIDALSPKAEWAPPYDLRDGSRPKALRIREAMEHVCAALNFPTDSCAPVAIRDPAEPNAAYGTQDLWALIANSVSPARAAKIARVQAANARWSFREILGQAGNAGRLLIDYVWRGNGSGSRAE